MTAKANTVPQLYSSIGFSQDTPARNTFDHDYLNRLSQGDTETERHFAHYFGDRLLKKLRCRFSSGQLAEDARQETLLRVLHFVRSHRGIQYPQRLAAFVNGVCENVISELMRATQRHSQTPEYAPEPFDERPSAESELLFQERKAIIHSVLGMLSQKDQMILRKAFWEECDYDQICSEMGLQRSNLRVRIHRALARFRAAIRSGDVAGSELALRRYSQHKRSA